MATGRTIARNSVFLAAAHGSTKVFSVALTAIAGRVLGPAGFGLYATGAALVEVGRVIASSGLDYLVAREVASDPSSASRVATNASAVKILAGVVTYFLLLGLVIWLDYPPPVLGVVLVLGSALFFENLSDVVDAVFQGREQMQATSRAFALSGAFLFVSGAAALLGGLGLTGYVACFALSFIVRFGFITRAARREKVAQIGASQLQRTEILRMLRAGVPLFGATVLSLIFHRMDLLMLGKMAPEVQVGLYAAAVRIIDVVVLLPRILATAVYPALRRDLERDKGEALRLLAESSRITLLLCSAAGLGVWLLAPLAIRLIPGEAFLPAVGALRVLSFGVVLQGGAHVFARLLLALDAEREFAFVAFFSLLLNAALNLLWIPRLGIEGAAWATLCSYSASLLLYLVVAARRGYRLPLRAPVAGPLLASAVALGLAFYAPLSSWALFGAMLGGWLLIALVTRSIRTEDWNTLLRIARSRG